MSTAGAILAVTAHSSRAAIAYLLEVEDAALQFRAVTGCTAREARRVARELGPDRTKAAAAIATLSDEDFADVVARVQRRFSGA